MELCTLQGKEIEDRIERDSCLKDSLFVKEKHWNGKRFGDELKLFQQVTPISIIVIYQHNCYAHFIVRSLLAISFNYNIIYIFTM